MVAKILATKFGFVPDGLAWLESARCRNVVVEMYLSYTGYLLVPNSWDSLYALAMELRLSYTNPSIYTVSVEHPKPAFIDEINPL